ncbi:MAG: hypothetical protein EOO44_15405 [Flavobacterium sp.]|nr:MAG: hypothetical protein EOO44_15405 [Flavobacterium sp.]
MSTNNLSKETELRLADFFNHSIDSKSMAKTIRQVNYLFALHVMLDKELQTNLCESFYWLNKLAETLDPYLDIE